MPSLSHRAISVSKPRISRLNSIMAGNSNVGPTTLFEKFDTLKYVYLPIYIAESRRKIATVICLLSNMLAIVPISHSLSAAWMGYNFLGKEHTIIVSSSWLATFTKIASGYNVYLLIAHLVVLVLMHCSKINRWRIKMIRSSCFTNATILFLVFVILPTLAASLIFLAVQKQIREEFTKSMKVLMGKYKQGKEHQELSKLVDTVQIENECCGATNYHDWFSEDIWKSHHHGCNTGAAHVFQLIPYSCCNSSSTRYCMIYTPKELFDETTRSKAIDQFRYNHYRAGCAAKFSNTFMTHIFHILVGWGALLGLNTFTLICLQYLGTSVHFALLWNRRPDNTSIGWLWGPPMQRLDLAALVMEHKEWTWRFKVKYRPLHAKSQKPLGQVKQQELKLASQLRVKQGLVSTVDGACGFRLAGETKECPEGVIEKLCSKVKSQYQ